MNLNTKTSAAGSAAPNLASRLLTLKEVAARLAVSPMTVHRMPLASIRLGRSLRFDPRDVEQLIEDSKEPVVLPQVAARVGVGRVKSLRGSAQGTVRVHSI